MALTIKEIETEIYLLGMEVRRLYWNGHVDEGRKKEEKIIALREQQRNYYERDMDNPILD